MNKQQLVAKGRNAAAEIKARPQFIVMSVAAIILLLWTFMASSNVSDRAERAIGVIESQQVLIDKLAVALDEARAQGATVPAPEVIAAEVPDVEVSPAVGATGERGDAGAPGEVGLSGDIGLTGAVGDKGDPGNTGATGQPGAQGPPGIGVAGADGANGADGATGPPGPAGTDGAPGANGAPGADGATGAQGPQGPGPTDEQIAAAVAAYCSVPGNCTVIP